jgi:hypothetical protein
LATIKEAQRPAGLPVLSRYSGDPATGSATAAGA